MSCCLLGGLSPSLMAFDRLGDAGTPLRISGSSCLCPCFRGSQEMVVQRIEPPVEGAELRGGYSPLK